MTTDLKAIRAAAEADLECPIEDYEVSISEIQSTTVIALLDRLEAAEAEVLEQARLLGIGGEKELSLMAKLEAAEAQLKQEALARKNVSTMLNELAEQLDAAEVENKKLQAKFESLVKVKNFAEWGGL